MNQILKIKQKAIRCDRILNYVNERAIDEYIDQRINTD